jgi:hypothetical protein
MSPDRHGAGLLQLMNLSLRTFSINSRGGTSQIVLIADERIIRVPRFALGFGEIEEQARVARDLVGILEALDCLFEIADHVGSARLLRELVAIDRRGRRFGRCRRWHPDQQCCDDRDDRCQDAHEIHPSLVAAVSHGPPMIRAEFRGLTALQRRWTQASRNRSGRNSTWPGTAA